MRACVYSLLILPISKSLSLSNQNTLRQNLICSPFFSNAISFQQNSELINREVVWFFQLNIPLDKRSQQWELVFSTSQDGHCWSQFCNNIMETSNANPDCAFIIIIRDKEGYVFGGYIHPFQDKLYHSNSLASFNPHFMGSSDTFLFSLMPSMRIYKATSYNHNYVYFNSNATTLPNGLVHKLTFSYKLHLIL